MELSQLKNVACKGTLLEYASSLCLQRSLWVDYTAPEKVRPSVIRNHCDRTIFVAPWATRREEQIKDGQLVTDIQNLFNEYSTMVQARLQLVNY